MPDSERLVVVSNRLPVSLERDGENWSFKRSAGGLATAMDPILRRAGGIWIGWSGSKEEDSPEQVERLRTEQSCVAVDLPADVATKFYEGYANEALWPLFHSFVSRLKFEPDAWDACNEANRRFCDAVVEQYCPGDRIWVHDYHLMLLPGLLRQRLPDAVIGFFLHIPFPASDVFAALPRGEELLNGVLGADLIAFQTHIHLQHFRRSLRRLLGIESAVDRVTLDGRVARIQALPIGIAPDDFLELLDAPETRKQIQKLRAEYAGRRVIVAVDRLDYTKGLPERLRTFRRLLNTRPDLRSKVVLLQVAVPSRENIGSYQDLRSEVHELVTEINGHFGTADWVPVVYIYRNIPRPELVALYHFADIAWVSPLRDGMNLVAKEYVACKPDGDGVLVLSSFAGAAAEMGEAILINPYDDERTCDSLVRALEMEPDEERERMIALHKRVLKNNVFAWGERFLALLQESVEGRSEAIRETPPEIDVNALERAWCEASKRIVLLDYDGTLVSFVARPQDAVPDDDLCAVLEALAADERNSVTVISGRAVDDLERWLGRISRLGLAAEHGVRMRPPGSAEWQGHNAPTDWKETVRPILDHFVERTPGSCVEEKEYALVWHFRTAEPEFADWLAGELVAMLDGMLAETELRAYRGNKIVEVKPLWANKGSFATAISRQNGEGTLLLCIGDDRTDEDMFAALPEDAWTIHVGVGTSKARFRIAGVRAVRDLLKRLIS